MSTIDKRRHVAQGKKAISQPSSSITNSVHAKRRPERCASVTSSTSTVEFQRNPRELVVHPVARSFVDDREQS